MSNTLTALTHVGYNAVQEVRRAITGLIAAVTTDYSYEMVPLNEAVKVPIIGAAAANADATPAAASSEGSATAVTTVDVKITKSRKNTFFATGEDALVINRIGFEKWFAMRVKASMIALVNEMEGDVANECRLAAGWGAGVAGTNPFTSDFKKINELYRIMTESGIPTDDLTLVLTPGLAESLRNQAGLWQNYSGNDDSKLLREGIMSPISKFKIRESAFLPIHTKGNAATWTTGGAAAGLKVVPITGGTGDFVAGDLVTIAGITDRKYVANGPKVSTNLNINSALYKAAVATSGVTIEAANHQTNFALHRRSVALAVRNVALPPGGDSATEVRQYKDESGLTFQVARYGQYLQASYEVRLAWGVKVVEPEAVIDLAS